MFFNVFYATHSKLCFGNGIKESICFYRSYATDDDQWQDAMSKASDMST